jgi:hypothetical protein
VSATETPVLDGEQRALIARVLRGTSIEDTAWTGRAAPELLLETARAAIYVSAPELLAELGEPDARRVTDYLLGLQSPGQAAGTEDLLEESDAARRWAVWVRELLSDLYPHGPPAVPGLGDPLPPADAPRERRSSPRRRRRERAEEEARKAARAAEAAGAAVFRPEALEHHRDGAGRIALPHFRGGRTVVLLALALVVLLAVVGAGLLLHVPSYRAQVATVVPTSAGPRLLVPVGEDDLRRLRVGSRVEWQIGEGDGPPATVRAITGRLTPARATRRFELGATGAALVPAPTRLALAEPEGRPLPVGTTGSARLRADDRRLVELLRP